MSRSFGDYVLMEEIARGGMGVVYKARQKSLDRIVALKMILAGEFASREELLRFRAEAHAAARLQHPDIVSIHESGEVDGLPYFSMDYVAGPNLAALVKERPLDARRAASVIRKIALAIQYAHEQGVLHRDLKPSNILVDAHDEPRVTDFGLAKHFTKESLLTVTGQVLGSPGFMPPEQAGLKGARPGPYSDVYGLGAILFYLVTGRPPFLGETISEVLGNVLHMEPISVRLLNSSVPRDYETICLKCLQKEPHRRYASAAELAADLERFLGNEVIAARPVGGPEKILRWCRRKPALAGALALSLVLLSGVSVISTVSAIRVLEARNSEAHFRALAENRESVTRENLYAVDMTVAELAIREDDRERALYLLDRNRPQTGQPDLRHWEWRYLWRMSQGNELLTLGFHTNVVTGVAYLPNAKYLASVSYDGPLKVWDLETRELVKNLVHGGSIFCVAASPDGQFLATGGSKLLIVWSTTNFTPVAELKHRANVRGCAFHPNGSTLATYDTAGYLRVWDWKAQKEIVTKSAASTDGSLRGAITYSHDGNILVLGDAAGKIRVFDSTRMSERLSFKGHSQGVTALATTRDNKQLASGGWDHALSIWSMDNGELLTTFTNHLAWISGVTFIDNDRKLVSSSADQTIQIRTLADGSITRLRGHAGEIWGFAASPDARMLATGGKDDAVKLWSTGASNVLPVLCWPNTNGVFALSPDGQRIAAVDDSGNVNLHASETFERIGHIPEMSASEVLFLGKANVLAVGTKAGFVHLLDVATGQKVETLNHQGQPIVELSLSATKQSLAVLDYAGNLALFDLHERRRRLTAHVTLQGGKVPKHSFSGDHRFLAISTSREIEIIEVATGKRVAQFTGYRERIRGLAFSPDGKTLATACEDSLIRLCEIASGKVLILRGHANGVHSLTYSPDGRRLITGGGDGDVRLWDVSTQQQVASFQMKGSVTSVFLAPDGDTLVAKSSVDGWRFWRAASWDEIGGGSCTPTRQPLSSRAVTLAGTSGELTKRYAIANADPDGGRKAALERRLDNEQFRLRYISPRPSQASSNLIDLSLFYNSCLTNNWHSGTPGNDLRTLPQGIQKFLDIEFDVRGLIQLSSRRLEERLPGVFPMVVEDIPVARLARRIHFLHGTCWKAATNGEQIGSYKLTFADGQSASFPIAYGEHVRDWHSLGDGSSISKAKLAWSGSNAVVAAANGKLRLYLLTLDNPRPEVPISSVTFSSSPGRSAPFLIALSVDP